MGYASEVKGSWFGVALPEWIRAFDCRGDGFGLYMGSEKAEVDLGLRSESESHATTPLSCRTYLDARTADEAELKRQVEDMLREAEKLRAEYESCGGLPDKGLGGSCFYQPLALCMSNFGWSILCDRRTGRTRFFQ